MPVILAGGQGTRVRHLLNEIPKPMYEVNGLPFIAWICLYLKKQGFNQVIASVGYLAHKIDKYFRENPVKGIQLTSMIENQPLGTAGGFKNVVDHSGNQPDIWMVLNGDSLVLVDLPIAIKKFLDSEAKAGIVAVRVDNVSRFGQLKTDDAGYLEVFCEKSVIGPGLINSGIYFFRSNIVTSSYFSKGNKISFEHEIFPNLLRDKKKIFVHIVNVPFIDIGTEESLMETSGFIQQNSNYFQ